MEMNRLLMTLTMMFMSIRQGIVSYKTASSYKLYNYYYINRNNVKLFSSNDKSIDSLKLSSYYNHFKHITIDQWNKLQSYNDILIEWNDKINTISRKDIDYVIPRHIIPSLAISLVQRFERHHKIIDVGTGGGFPGIPLAILHPNTSFTLLDSNTKKIIVVKDVINRLQLSNVHVIWDRAENVKDTYDYVVGRAVTAIPNFLDFSSHLIKDSNDDNKGLYYIKGGDFINELKEANINDYKLHSINDLIPELSTDKFVLYVPSNQITKYYKAKLKKLK